MENKNKGWSTGLPDFSIKENIKDTHLAESNQKIKSRIVNFGNKKIKYFYPLKKIIKISENIFTMNEKLKKYKVVIAYEDLEYSQCERTKKRKVDFFYNKIDSHGNLVRTHGINLNRNYLIDYDYLEGKNHLPRSPKELMGKKPIPKR